MSRTLKQALEAMRESSFRKERKALMNNPDFMVQDAINRAEERKQRIQRFFAPPPAPMGVPQALQVDGPTPPSQAMMQPFPLDGSKTTDANGPLGAALPDAAMLRAFSQLPKPPGPPPLLDQRPPPPPTSHTVTGPGMMGPFEASDYHAQIRGAAESPAWDPRLDLRIPMPFNPPGLAASPVVQRWMETNPDYRPFTPWMSPTAKLKGDK